MTAPGDRGLAEFITLSGASYKVETQLDDFLEFVFGATDYWLIEEAVDEQGVQKTIYLPFHGVEQFLWHDHQLARKRRAKGKK